MSGEKGPRPSPEDRARGAWERRHGTLARERDRWMRATMASLGVAAVAVGFGVWAAVSTEYVPYIVRVDELDRPSAALAPREITEWPDAVVRHELAAFLRDWRSVSLDRAAMEGRFRRIQYFLERNSAADLKVIAWARDSDTNPFRIAETRTSDVDVVAVNQLGGRSWLAEWTETRRNRTNGRAEAPQRFQGTFVLGRRIVRDDAVLLWNPLGMVVEDFDIVRVQ
ncbi:MAG: type IV secretion system protein [Boseongicola sp. SB0677_bin_26]|nr:type IV secretion system protein [Boseongicola sp. SB0677_bin_26]